MHVRVRGIVLSQQSGGKQQIQLKYMTGCVLAHSGAVTSTLSPCAFHSALVVCGAEVSLCSPLWPQVQGSSVPPASASCVAGMRVFFCFYIYTHL